MLPLRAEQNLEGTRTLTPESSKQCMLKVNNACGSVRLCFKLNAENNCGDMLTISRFVLCVSLLTFSN